MLYIKGKDSESFDWLYARVGIWKQSAGLWVQLFYLSLSHGGTHILPLSFLQYESTQESQVSSPLAVINGVQSEARKCFHTAFLLNVFSNSCCK